MWYNLKILLLFGIYRSANGKKIPMHRYCFYISDLVDIFRQFKNLRSEKSIYADELNQFIIIINPFMLST